MSMEFGLNDIVEMKKQHPCGNSLFKVTRVGADIKIKCIECERTILMPRRDFIKRMKKIVEKHKGEE